MLPNYSDILVATDLSQSAVNAFKHAVMMARRNKAKIHLLHVVPEVDAAMHSYISALMAEGSLDQFESRNKELARQEIERRLKQFAKDELSNHPEDLERVVTIEVAHGHPVVKILETADRLNVDVIVMGSHGKGAIEHAFLGSTTEKVLRKSKRPVFVIPIA